MKKENLRKEQFNSECKWLITKPIYHRGKFDNINAHENTLEAFKLSLLDNSPFEFDVQLTNDNQVVCFHDKTLKRMFNRERLVSDISYKRLNKLRDDLKVPLLKDVLEIINGKVELMIELKSRTRKLNSLLVKKVHELLKDYNGKYVIVSFNPNLLRKYKKLDKEAFLGRIGSGKYPRYFEKYIISNHGLRWLVKPDFISYDIDNPNDKLFEYYKSEGYPIIGWSLKNTANINELKKIYDNFIIEGIESKEL